MKLTFTFFLLVQFVGDGFSQSLSASLQSLVDAEKAFASTSKRISTNQAFLDYLAPDAVVLDAGKEVNGIELWKKRPVSESLLFWEPVYADIASSQDFGYTTGPYYFYKLRTDTVPAFKGFYSTVWGKQSDGNWKVLFDLGGGIPDKDLPVLSTSRVILKPSKSKRNLENELKDLLALDRSYSEKLNPSSLSFDPAFFSTEGRLHRPGKTPVIGLDNIKSTKEEGRKFEFTPLSGRIASSADMGYTYGKSKASITRDGNVRVVEGGYFRIWKKEDGKNWKLVLDVIGQ